MHAEDLAARDQGRLSPPLSAEKVAAVAVEHMAPGPAMAGWLSVAAGAAGWLDEDGLTGLAVGARRQAAHAQALELRAVGQITARAAAADRKIGLGPDGRPVRVCRDAVGQVEMALTLSHDGAESLADLAVTLTWRLADTGAALAAGWIDLDRARIIAQYTSWLAEDAAREVEAKVLPIAPGLTCARLRQRLAALVIAVDPEGAEERRTRNESYADLRLFGGDDQTAALVADKLPQVLAAAGYWKINALARARKKAGLPGSLGQHRVHVLFEMILGRLDLIPPAEADPPASRPRPVTSRRPASRRPASRRAAVALMAAPPVTAFPVMSCLSRAMRTRLRMTGWTPPAARTRVVPGIRGRTTTTWTAPGPRRPGRRRRRSRPRWPGPPGRRYRRAGGWM